MLPAVGCFDGRGELFFPMTGLEVNLPIEIVETWLCGGGMKVGGGAELEAGDIVE